ncbi:MAG: flavodoxin reductase [Gammaproteobacteria bacterium]|nr:flavodoxin reductase [Gammaproteobacteria bacterium]NIR98895.1 flavodoxin reductase [Gammaproteobacteria bacterium]NIT64016.1 flavodoxin reductase [Gammaproteobacteria bacterium]NIV19176.1 flavodoxin reductase [Gammaproteobacteria bacterium]NIX10345.1 flavodoxin reductase [Gammaproteobacteria bacterium]
MDYTVNLLMSEFVTHDVKRFIVDKPDGLDYEPGQGVELAIDLPDWKDEGRPFTPTSLPQDRVLELTIKAYPDHHGVTERLHGLAPGAGLRMSKPFGTITYRGPGVFIAGGAGITPFIAILRRLAAQGELEANGLIFSNKTPADVIGEKEFRHYLGQRCTLTCTAEAAPGYDHRRIDAQYLREKIDDFGQHFYVCGPPRFVEEINEALQGLGTSPNALVFEG